MTNPYQVQGATVPRMLGRETLLRRLLDRLAGGAPQHVSVVGPALYGKSVLLNDLVLRCGDSGDDCGLGSRYAACVYWDFRVETPCDDDDFRSMLLGKLEARLCSSGHEVPTDLDHLFERLTETGERLLIVLDSLEYALPRGVTTRRLWSEVHRLARLPSLRLVTGSRIRIQAMVEHRVAIGHDDVPLALHELFYPPEIEVGSLSVDDWESFLAPLRGRLDLTDDAERRLVVWTGRVPMLAAWLARELVDSRSRGTEVSGSTVDETAERLVRPGGGNDPVRRFYKELKDEHRQILAQLDDYDTVAAGGGVSGYLERFGLATQQEPDGQVGPRSSRRTAIGRYLQGSCKLVTAYAARQIPDATVEELIERGESKTVEFKSTLRWSFDTGGKNDRVTHAALRTIAAFLNTEGGNLLLGVADDGSIVGIENDRFDSYDEFLRHLDTKVRNELGIRAARYIKPRIHILKGGAVCIVTCGRCSESVFLRVRKSKSSEEYDFFIRSGPATHRLTPDEAETYRRRIWQPALGVFGRASDVAEKQREGEAGDNRVDAALAFAARAHQGQMRKGTGIPYIAHPAAVAAMLARAGCDEDLVAAGALHDVVEDTKHGFADIEALFGRRVAGLVRACSEPDKSRRSWEERRRHTLEMLEEGVDADVAMLMCADKLHNARSMLTDWRRVGDALWTRFNRGKERQRWYLRGLANAFDRYEGEMFLEYRAIVDELFPPDEEDGTAPVEEC